MNWRGEYEGGGFVVTAKRWWWPKDRKDARIAAEVMKVMGPKVQASARRACTTAMLYGKPVDLGRIEKGA